MMCTIFRGVFVDVLFCNTSNIALQVVPVTGYGLLSADQLTCLPALNWSQPLFPRLSEDGQSVLGGTSCCCDETQRGLSLGPLCRLGRRRCQEGITPLL